MLSRPLKHPVPTWGTCHLEGRLESKALGIQLTLCHLVQKQSQPTVLQGCQGHLVLSANMPKSLPGARHNSRQSPYIWNISPPVPLWPQKPLLKISAPNVVWLLSIPKVPFRPRSTLLTSREEVYEYMAKSSELHSSLLAPLTSHKGTATRGREKTPWKQKAQDRSALRLQKVSGAYNAWDLGLRSFCSLSAWWLIAWEGKELIVKSFSLGCPLKEGVRTKRTQVPRPWRPAQPSRTSQKAAAFPSQGCLRPTHLFFPGLSCSWSQCLW